MACLPVLLWTVFNHVQYILMCFRIQSAVGSSKDRLLPGTPANPSDGHVFSDTQLKRRAIFKLPHKSSPTSSGPHELSPGSSSESPRFLWWNATSYYRFFKQRYWILRNTSPTFSNATMQTPSVPLYQFADTIRPCLVSTVRSDAGQLSIAWAGMSITPKGVSSRAHINKTLLFVSRPLS